MLLVVVSMLATVDLEASSVTCPTTQMVTAGEEVACVIELRTSGGIPTGDESMLCLFSSNISNSYDGGVDAEEYECTGATLASPFHWTGETGKYMMRTTPTVSGIVRGSLFYTDSYGTSPMADIMYYVQPAIEDHGKLVSSCDVISGFVECTTLHRDRFGNKLKQCFQRWDADPVSTCTMIPYTSTN